MRTLHRLISRVSEIRGQLQIDRHVAAIQLATSLDPHECVRGRIQVVSFDKHRVEFRCSKPALVKPVDVIQVVKVESKMSRACTFVINVQIDRKADPFLGRTAAILDNAAAKVVVILRILKVVFMTDSVTSDIER